jgi:hypothetical protein
LGTGCSWLNMVERFFRDLTENRLALRNSSSPASNHH